ncbi:MAG: PLP-dependent transferase [Actinomycetota bacterium]|nr:PLP-dependent transferase [Actinomycetota bacterium]
MEKSTKVVHGGRPKNVTGAPLNFPIGVSTTYIAGGTSIYSRFGTEVTRALEEVIAELEGGETLSFASGLAAVKAVVDSFAKAVGRPLDVAIVEGAYNGTRMQLNGAMGLIVRSISTITASTPDIFCDELSSLQEFDLVWLETPTNPLMSVLPIDRVVSIAKAKGAFVVVDNTFATPFATNPLEFGADVVIHSATKFFGGHSDVLGGTASFADPAVAKEVDLYRRLNGSILGDFEAFLILRGIRTLSLRVRAACENALAIVELLGEYLDQEMIYHPSLLVGKPGYEFLPRQMLLYGSMLSFDLGSSPFRAERFCERLHLAKNSTSLGAVETQVERREKQELGISPGLIRVSVGIEAQRDLVEDFNQALELL